MSETIKPRVPSLTDNEVKALHAIATDEFNFCNTALPESDEEWSGTVNCQVWAWSPNPFENKRTFAGVVSSLAKKGLTVSEQGENADDDRIALTQAGVDALRAVL